VSDKGCDLLLLALSVLKSQGMEPTLTVVGDGPERQKLESLTKELDLGAQVSFLGAKGKGRGRIIAQHKIMVIPSLWNEPFGVVALEGIAAGCPIVASSGGGLKDAVGPCGLFFPNGDKAALAENLRRLLADPDLRRKLISKGPEHLKVFQPSLVVDRYLDLFNGLVR
jgi:glycogen(starch) synthase